MTYIINNFWANSLPRLIALAVRVTIFRTSVLRKKGFGIYCPKYVTFVKIQFFFFTQNLVFQDCNGSHIGQMPTVLNSLHLCN